MPASSQMILVSTTSQVTSMVDRSLRIQRGPEELGQPLLRSHGLTLVVPAGWEARIRKSGEIADGGTRYPVIHAATVPLPTMRGDYGSNVVESLGSGDVFISVIEFGSEAIDSPLFESLDSFPAGLSPDEFHPRQLQRVIPGQAGMQRFFTVAGRAFCIYVVVGSYLLVELLASKAEELLAGILIDRQ